MKISTKILKEKVYYTDIFFDGAAYPVCCFGVIDTITVDKSSNCEYLTVVDNKGRRTNFATTEMIKTYSLNAMDIGQLVLLRYEMFMKRFLYS